MRALAVLRLAPGTDPATVAIIVHAEVTRLWQLYLDGTVTAAHQTSDSTVLVLELDGQSLDDLHRQLNTLPMVKTGLLITEIHALTPFQNWERLFAPEGP